MNVKVMLLQIFSMLFQKDTGDLARELTKDPYNFDFIALHQGYKEKELKDALMDNVQKLLMELGRDFTNNRRVRERVRRSI